MCVRKHFVKYDYSITGIPNAYNKHLRCYCGLFEQPVASMSSQKFSFMIVIIITQGYVG